MSSTGGGASATPRWRNTAEDYDSEYAKCYTDEDGDKVCIYSEQDWDECVYGWRQRDDKVLRLTWVPS